MSLPQPPHALPPELRDRIVHLLQNALVDLDDANSYVDPGEGDRFAYGHSCQAIALLLRDLGVEPCRSGWENADLDAEEHGG